VAKLSLVCVLCAGVLTFAPAISIAQTREAESQVTVQGTVEAVDYTGRVVTIRGQQGNVVTLDVPANAPRFEQVKVGDPVTATYYDRISVRVKPAGELAVDRTEEALIAAPPGALPGATRTRQRVATVTITGWSPVDRVVTFIGPNGTAYSRRLLDTTDPAIVEGLKVGDRVDVTRTEAVTVSVQAATATVTDNEFLHRFTASAMIGWDNQFGGKMIKEATGRTTGGVPINLDQTTYDEVYGRIGMFKIGVGYRTTPRAEVVLNFVWSSSSAEETGVVIGTVGANTAAIPVTVNFTSFKYWGLEVGQRWFFARTRFTPFVGYLVGTNRHQDIYGTFVNVPPNLTPGLAAQNGKFFEKSWAISLGPTGGVLIGVGPFEVIAETQLRFIGGLSDVDWLVEEGLRDINSESSRWSFPILLGGRIRF